MSAGTALKPSRGLISTGDQPWSRRSKPRKERQKGEEKEEREKREKTSKSRLSPIFWGDTLPHARPLSDSSARFKELVGGFGQAGSQAFPQASKQRRGFPLRLPSLGFQAGSPRAFGPDSSLPAQGQSGWPIPAPGTHQPSTSLELGDPV